jgi:hypothetical protein
MSQHPVGQHELAARDKHLLSWRTW